MTRESIEHEGIIVAKEYQKLSIEITNKSMCGGCNARELCSSADVKQKIIEIEAPSAASYTIGDKVTVVGSRRLALYAVVLAYVLPLIVVVAVLIACKQMGYSDGVAGGMSLAALPPYYLILYTLRNKLRKELIFRIKQ